MTNARFFGVISSLKMFQTIFARKIDKINCLVFQMQVKSQALALVVENQLGMK